MQIARQIEWEIECCDRGSERYYAHQDRLRSSGSAETTDAASVLIRTRLEDAAQGLKEVVTGHACGVQASYNAVIRSLATEEEDYLKLAYIGIRAVLRSLQMGNDKNTATAISREIAHRVEVDYKCRLFEAANPAYYDTVRRSFAEQKVTDYMHMQKVLMKKFSDFDLEWNHWSNVEQVQIGSRILRSLLNTFGDIVFLNKRNKRNKTVYYIDTTVAFDEWSGELEKERGLLSPLYLPLKAPPRPWTKLNDGGYHTPQMQMSFVKTRGRDHVDYVKSNLPDKHMTAANRLQRTAWSINHKVLQVQEEIYRLNLGIGVPSSKKIVPLDFPDKLRHIEKEDLTPSQRVEIGEWKNQAKYAYGKEETRKGKVLAFMSTLRLAREVSDWEKMYFVYTADFRGRLYCATSGLSPQGADSSKGLLKFAKGKPLGRTGAKWLAIHGANTYGVDKVSNDDRRAWARSMEAAITAVVDDPISNRDVWGNADKPYQFLAFCFDWAACDFGRNNKALSYIPVGQDGSCNGLQHFSAMLRDSEGAAATNLIDADIPQDIYRLVADVTTELLKDIDHPYAKVWLRVHLDRKCAKKPVMTLPYGATQSSAREAVMDYVTDNWVKFGRIPEEHQWPLAKFLTPILWKAIGKVVVAARLAMDWIKKSIPQDYVKWLTPIGFPVYQSYAKIDSRVVKTQLEGLVRLRVSDYADAKEPSLTAQRSGIAPNFVHSLDSTHLVMTVLDTKFDAYAMIHDDFGTHACDSEALGKAIREAFYKLYTFYNPLMDWANQLNISTESAPEVGNYDISLVKGSTYFFG